jgi:perosamine synthetase
MMDSAARPACLGGLPVRSGGPPGWPIQSTAVRLALDAAWESGDWGRYHGAQHQRLVQVISQFLQVEHVLPCSSGTVAVELALRGLKVGADDEVILSAYDFKGNFQDVLAIGAVPVLVDVDPRSWQLGLRDLAAAITPKTKAIIASHLHGGLVPMPEVMELAREKKILVLEDACQMPGAMVAGRPAGTWGDVGTWSFGGSKLLTAGRGGAVFTRSNDIAQRIRLWNQRGNEAHPLSELQAAVLVPQIEGLKEQELRRHQNVERLRELLSWNRGLVPFPSLLIDSQAGYYKLGLQYSQEEFRLSRDRFAAAMRAEGIALDAGFRSLHKIHSARRFRSVGELKVASHVDENVLVLHHPILLSDNDTDLLQIVQAVEKIRQHVEEIAIKPIPDCR